MVKKFEAPTLQALTNDILSRPPKYGPKMTAIGYSMKKHQEMLNVSAEDSSKTYKAKSHIAVYRNNSTGEEHLVTASGTTLEKLQEYKDQGELIIATCEEGFSFQKNYLTNDQKVLKMAEKHGFKPN